MLLKLALDCLHFVWIAVLLGACAGGWGAWSGRRLRLPPSLLLPVGAALFCAGALAVFFGSYAAPQLGRFSAWIWVAASLAVFVFQWRSSEGRRRLRQRDCWLPGALLFLLAAAYLALLFAANTPPAQRFTWELPIDDQLPHLFADRLAAGESPTPLCSDWLSSDRPPLQAALDLTLRSWYFRHRPAINYQFLGTLLQMLWLPALFALGRAVRLGGRQIGFVLLCCATAGFFLLNSVYVWPKLLAAALVITAIAVLFTAVRERRPEAGLAALAGGCAALGLLAHGGVAFSLLALPALPAAWRFLRQVRWRGLGAAALAGAVVLAPWISYQKFCDPPGNRLLKMHLAGVNPIDERGVMQAMRDSYRAQTPDAWRFARFMNWRALVAYDEHFSPGEDTTAYLRHQQFFIHLPALGILPLGLVALGGTAVFRRRSLPDFAGGLLLHVGVTAALWNLLMFVPGSAVIHQGSYAFTALLFFLCASGLSLLPPRWHWSVFGIHALAFGWVWIVSTPPAPGISIHVPEAILSALFAAAFVAALCWIPENAAETPALT